MEPGSTTQPTYQNCTYVNIPSHIIQIFFSGSVDAVSMPYTPLQPQPLAGWHTKPFGHIILTQTLLAELFSRCSGTNSQGASPTADGEEQVNEHVHAMLLALNRWLQMWLKTPNASPNAIPLGGTAAEQKTGLMSDPSSPFLTSSLSSDSSPVTAFTLPPAYGAKSLSPGMYQFRLIKSWLHHIWLFLRRSQGSPTVVWDELMKIRLSGWQEDAAAFSQQDPLLGEAQKDGGGADDPGSWPEHI
ncbi:hypothetical protein EDB92DRAFT_1949727 [Lactarius akahatsu]|uniref:Uncharacterized protein n=1 Tax=Lactarius akahatsu TaxID=416441 RepID=A0AAD4LDR3_9AGAM|nr:hypothetical protein EDB92DRAFT_1949727 [Lactarius akahatsu]